MRVVGGNRRVTDQHKRLVRQVWCEDYLPAGEVVARIQAGKWYSLEAHDGEGQLRALLVYSVCDYPHGRELEVQLISSVPRSDGGSYTGDFWPALWLRAAHQGVRRIEVRSEREGMRAILDRLGFERVSTIHRVEVG